MERAAELAYSLAAEEAKLKTGVKDAFELFQTHCDDHATALSEALDQLGVDPPEAHSDPADYDRLADFDPKAKEPELLDFMVSLEEELVAVYEDAQSALEAEDLVRTAAQIGAAHAQMLVALRLQAGVPPVDLLAVALMDAKPPSDSRATLVRWMGIEDANHAGMVHGGVVMKLCDEVAAIAAIRHSGHRAVTAAMDRMTFIEPGARR